MFSSSKSGKKEMKARKATLRILGSIAQKVNEWKYILFQKMYRKGFLPDLLKVLRRSGQ